MYVYSCHSFSHLESKVSVIVLAVLLSIVILNLIITRKDIVIAMDGCQLSFVFHLECTVAVIALALLLSALIPILIYKATWLSSSWLSCFQLSFSFSFRQQRGCNHPGCPAISCHLYSHLESNVAVIVLAVLLSAVIFILI